MSSQPTQSFIRGGQITLHNLRMMRQVTNQLGMLFLIIVISVTFWYFWNHTDENQRYYGMKYLEAFFWNFMNVPKAMVTFHTSFQPKTNYPSWLALTLPIAQESYLQCKNSLIHGFIFAFVCGTCIVTFVVYWLRLRGSDASRSQLIKGDQFVEQKKLIKFITQHHQLSGLTLNMIPLPIDHECSHFLFHGTTGTGKSTAIKQLLDQIRERGDQVIIYDKGGTYLEDFFDEEKDALLNPLDSRSKHWNLWQECQDASDYVSLAAGLIPQTAEVSDPFWTNSARAVLTSLMQKMGEASTPTIKKLLHLIYHASLEELHGFLAGTEGAELTSPKMGKTSLSIRSVLTGSLTSLRFLSHQSADFSIRNWVENEQLSGWLFLTSSANKHETLRPLITTWLDIAINALLSLPQNPERRIWFILDELPSLHQLPISHALAEARKFGGCFVLGIQNYAQAEHIYGSYGARDISSLVNTRIIFRQPDPKMAQWSSENLGKMTREETREGISYGANTIRDGISINRAEVTHDLVSPSEIMQLSNLEAYLRLSGNYPITKVTFPFIARTKRVQAFVKKACDMNYGIAIASGASCN